MVLRQTRDIYDKLLIPRSICVAEAEAEAAKAFLLSFGELPWPSELSEFPLYT